MFRLAVLLLILGAAHGAPTLKSPGLDGRIVGGHDTTIEHHPWQVSLQHQDRHFCGAVLIAPTWALTVAHCVDRRPIVNITVRAGSTSRSIGGQIIEVTKAVLYSDSRLHDIAIVQLAVPVTIFNARAATIPAAGAPIADGAIATVTGWGTLSERGSSPEVLQEVQVPVINQGQCRDAYDAFSPNMVSDDMFCAGDLLQGGKDGCQGDSGGPAVVNNVVVGLISWGLGCARPGFPGVYVRISHYRNWITEVCGV